MILIEKGKKTHLPKEYHFVNNICAHIYNQITEIFSDKHYVGMLGTNINDINGEVISLLENHSLHPFDALNKTERYSELEIVLTKHIVMSLISDMVNYIYESIIIAQKGKMSVAYTLLRKPFLDQLFILEQILVDRKDFIERFFHNGDPQEYDPSSNKINKLALIKKSVFKLNAIALNAEIIYELRYDKASRKGINWLTNHAIHIVTNDKNYKTENQNLNFTFSADQDVELYWNHYFSTVPMLLIYTASVVDSIVFTLIKPENGIKELKNLERLLANMMIFDEGGKHELKHMYKLLSRIMITKCDICNHINRFSKKDLNDYFFDRLFLCKKCHNNLIMSATTHEGLKYLFEEIQKN